MASKNKLTDEVAELVTIGQLHEFDAEWICKLKPEQQLAAAKKCMKGGLLMMPESTGLDIIPRIQDVGNRYAQ